MPKPNFHVTRLTSGYQKFFQKGGPPNDRRPSVALMLALSPYIAAALAAQAIFKTKDSTGAGIEKTEKSVKATLITLTVIPILPALTLVTMALTLLATALAGLAALIAYPVAATLDAMKCCTPDTTEAPRM